MGIEFTVGAFHDWCHISALQIYQVLFVSDASMYLESPGKSTGYHTTVTNVTVHTCGWVGRSLWNPVP